MTMPDAPASVSIDRSADESDETDGRPAAEKAVIFDIIVFLVLTLLDFSHRL
jgi:hypothetical protein